METPSQTDASEEIQVEKKKKKASRPSRGINYDILKGHPYEIKDNPNKGVEKNSKIYICKYANCGKIFKKTWNLVYHFRVHNQEMPYECKK